MVYDVNLIIPAVLVGKAGEKDVKQVQFDISDWKQRYGNGEMVLLIQRHGDSVIYPVDLDVVGTIATWTVSDTDTARKGTGKGTLQYSVNGKIKKSKIFSFHVQDALLANSPAPTPYSNYVNQVLDARDEAVSAAELAKQYGYKFSHDGHTLVIGEEDEA